VLLHDLELTSQCQSQNDGGELRIRSHLRAKVYLDLVEVPLEGGDPRQFRNGDQVC